MLVSRQVMGSSCQFGSSIRLQLNYKVSIFRCLIAILYCVPLSLAARGIVPIVTGLTQFLLNANSNSRSRQIKQNKKCNNQIPQYLLMHISDVTAIEHMVYFISNIRIFVYFNVCDLWDVYRILFSVTVTLMLLPRYTGDLTIHLTGPG